MDACAGNVTDVCNIGQELLMSVRNFSQCQKLVATFVLYLIVAQSVPHTYSSRPSAFKRFNLLCYQSFQRTYNDHNATMLGLSGPLSLQLSNTPGSISSSTRTSRFRLGGKQTHHDRLRRLVPLSVVQKTRLCILVGRSPTFAYRATPNYLYPRFLAATVITS